MVPACPRQGHQPARPVGRGGAAHFQGVMEQERLHPSWEWGLLEEVWWQRGPAWGPGRCLRAVSESRPGYFLYLLISCWCWWLIRAAAGHWG